MNEKSFEAKLARVSAPAPDPAARLKAKRAALEEFARMQVANQESAKSTSASGSKGLWDALRLFRDDSSHGRTSMTWFVRRNLFAGVAGACVVGLGIAMVWPIFSHYGDSRVFDDLRSPEVTVDLKPPPQPMASDEPKSRAPAAKPPVAEPQSFSNEKDDRRDRLAKREAGAAAAASVAQDASAQLQAATPPPVETVQELRVEGVRIATPQAQNSVQPMISLDREEIVVTGARASGAPQTAHKGMAAAVAGRSSQRVAGLVAPASPPTAVMELYLESPAYAPDEGRDKFEKFDVNPVRQVAEAPVSTFSADVDTASYSFLRRQLNAGRLPQKDSVRVEELLRLRVAGRDLREDTVQAHGSS
jgi:Ca-activated chloride channel family protein